MSRIVRRTDYVTNNFTVARKSNIVYKYNLFRKQEFLLRFAEVRAYSWQLVWVFLNFFKICKLK